MIVVTNDMASYGREAHLQDAESPVHPMSMENRGYALCGTRIERQNYTWTNLPSEVEDSDSADSLEQVLIRQDWVICADCMLVAIP